MKVPAFLRLILRGRLTLFNGDEENKNNNKSVEFTKLGIGQMGKKSGKKASKAVGKLIVKGVMAVGSFIVSTIGLPIILLVTLSILFFGWMYYVNPANLLLTSDEQTEYDQIVKEYSIQTIDHTNNLETFLVEGEGSFYPDKYTKIGEMVDNNGLDVRIANEWGDAYAPAFWKSFISDFDEDKLEDRVWLTKTIAENAFTLRPHFYYKESSVTVCSVDEEGESHCSTYSIYLLVEAFTIRGHNQYFYEWHTETYDDGGSITYERLKDTKNLDDGKVYLTEALTEILTVDGEELAEEDDLDLTVEMIWQSMLGFTAEAEWLAWLDEYGEDILATVSQAQIPIEYRAFLEEASEITGIPTFVLAAIIIKESSWNPMAVNENTDCFGLTQLHPDYFEAWCERYGFDPVTDKWNPRTQIIIGARVFADYMGAQPDWESADWHEDIMFNAALARYGGYGDDVENAQGYITEIVEIAEAYKNRISGSPAVGYGREAISSYFGRRINPTTGEPGEPHTGIDFAIPEGTEIVSVSAGVVTQAKRLTNSYGYHIFISDGVYTYIYAHLSNFFVKVGDTVLPGETIAVSGNTGRSTGPHLHFEVRVKNTPIDPLSVLDI